jgi:hypothetical protein
MEVGGVMPAGGLLGGPGTDRRPQEASRAHVVSCKGLGRPWGWGVREGSRARFRHRPAGRGSSEETGRLRLCRWREGRRSTPG